MNRNFLISVIGGLSALSCAFQLLHLGYQIPGWGMWIDFVSAFWIIAYFILGFKAALSVSVISSVFIIIFSPDTLIGAIMKFSATFPLVIALEFGRLLILKKISSYRNPVYLILPFIIGILLRTMIILPLNYFYAIPYFTHSTTQAALEKFPWYFLTLINIFQSALDIGLAWLLVYKFRLNKYSAEITDS